MRVAAVLKFVLLISIICKLGKCQSEEDDDDPSDEENLAMKAIVEGNQKFAKKFYSLLKDLKPQNGNFVFSPYSISALFGMLRSGSTGNRKNELQQAMELQSLSDAQITTGFSELIQHFPDNDDIHYKSLERIYVPISHQIRLKFKESLQEEFSAPGSIRSADFPKSVTTAEKINKWVSQRTKGKLTSIISPDTISKDTKLTLISAVYFRGIWENSFTIIPPSENGTTYDLFYLNETHAAASVTYMNQHGKLKYTDLPDMKSEAVAIPFSGERLEMVIVVPKNRDGLQFPLEEEYIQGNRTLTSILTSMKSRNVNLFLPQFDAESFWTFSHTDQRSMLTKLGLQVDPSLRGLLDYNGITPYPGLYLDKIVHKVSLSLTEVGNQPPEEPPEAESIVVRADHPFIYFIRDTETKAILLLGRKTF